MTAASARLNWTSLITSHPKKSGRIDDGVDEFQCLACRGYWTSRQEPRENWKFCPRCATQWDGEHKWENKRIYCPGHAPQVYPEWVIEIKSKEPIFSDEDWDDTFSRPFFLEHAINVKSYLQHYREFYPYLLARIPRTIKHKPLPLP